MTLAVFALTGVFLLYHSVRMVAVGSQRTAEVEAVLPRFGFAWRIFLGVFALGGSVMCFVVAYRRSGLNPATLSPFAAGYSFVHRAILVVIVTGITGVLGSLALAVMKELFAFFRTQRNH